MSRVDDLWASYEISRERQDQAWSPHTSERDRKRLAECDDKDVRCAVATSPYTPKPLLRQLFREFPFQVALNSQTPAGTMDGWLGTDTEPWQREAIARNPKTTEDQLYRLADDPELSVRARVACRRDLTEGLIEKLSADGDPNVRCAIARRKDTPKHVIDALLDDENQNVRRAALSNGVE